MTYVLEQMSLS